MEIHEAGELDEKLAESAFASHDGSSQGRCWSHRGRERKKEAQWIDDFRKSVGWKEQTNAACSTNAVA